VKRKKKEKHQSARGPRSTATKKVERKAEGGPRSPTGGKKRTRDEFRTRKGKNY